MQRLAAQRYLRRRVLVTAAGSGIGKAIATRLHAEGAHVCGVDIDAEAISATAEELPGMLAVSGCVSEEDTVIRIASDVERAFGGLDGLVNSERASHPLCTLSRQTRPEMDLACAASTHHTHLQWVREFWLFFFLYELFFRFAHQMLGSQARQATSRS